MASPLHMAPSPVSGSYWILSVDDEPVILATRREILRGAGYEVINASDGNEALQLFNASHVDLVLLDFRMPGMDGGEVAREMKRRRPDVPIVIVTGYTGDTQSIDDVDFALEKGQHPLVLLQVVAKLLARRKRK